MHSMEASLEEGVKAWWDHMPPWARLEAMTEMEVEPTVQTESKGGWSEAEDPCGYDGAMMQRSHGYLWPMCSRLIEGAWRGWMADGPHRNWGWEECRCRCLVAGTRWSWDILGWSRSTGSSGPGDEDPQQIWDGTPLKGGETKRLTDHNEFCFWFWFWLHSLRLSLLAVGWWMTGHWVGSGIIICEVESEERSTTRAQHPFQIGG